MCTSIRIRTRGEYAHPADTIEVAADAWGCNKTRAVLLSCGLATYLLNGLEGVLTDRRVPPEVAADAVDHPDRTRDLSATYTAPAVTIDADR